MSDPLQTPETEMLNELAPFSVELSFFDSELKAVQTLPGFARYLGKVGLIPAMEPSFYPDLVEQIKAEKADPVATLMRVVFEETGGDGQHFAWVQLLRFLSHSRRARKETTGPVLHLDICSAVPLGSELQRSLDFTRCGIYANRLVNEFLAQKTEPVYGDQEAMQLSREVLSPKKSLTRQLLESHLRKILYTIDEEDIELATSDQELATLLAQRMMYECVWGNELFITDRHPGHYEGRMAVDTSRHTVEQTVFEMLAVAGTPTPSAVKARQQHKKELEELAQSLGVLETSKQKRRFNHEKAIVNTRYKDAVKEVEPLGKNRTADALYDICNQLCVMAVSKGMARPLRCISIDCEDPEVLLAAAERSFMYETRRMGLYRRALARLALPPEYGDHHMADILDPSYWEHIQDDSTALITSLEGFPLLFNEKETTPGRLTIEQAAAVMYQKLQINGYLVFFAWGINGELANGQPTLKRIIANWSEQGADISVKYYRRDILMEAISNSHDLSLIGQSAIFDPHGEPDDILELMVVQKSEDAVRLASQMRKDRIYESIRTPGLPGPKQ